MKCSRIGDVLKVEGSLSAADSAAMLEQGAEILGSDASLVTIDLRAMIPTDSSFVGVIASLGSDARARQKTLVVEATGRAADMLSWAGLHRLVTLHISAAPVQAIA